MLKRLFGPNGHKNPVPEGQYRLVRLTDYPWNDYSGYRAWCDAKLRACGFCGGKCCDCQHTERRKEQ